MQKSAKSDIFLAGELAQHAAADPSYIPFLINTLGEKGTARFQAAKYLQLISRAKPSLLYSHFNTFAALLDNPSSVLLWNGIIILSYLAQVDTARRFDEVFDRYYRHLWDGKLVTAANILGSSGRIAHARPDLADKITAQLLKADEIPLPTTECREVARGAALSSFAEYQEALKDSQSACAFILRCIHSHRPSVKKQAGELAASLSLEL